MKRTIEEVMDLLEQKRENALKTLATEQEENKKAFEKGKAFERVSWVDTSYIKGEIDAYTDVICLIASSHLLNKGE